MKGLSFIITTAALATAAVIFIRAAQAGEPASTIDPGFVPNTGQINPGDAAHPWSATTGRDQQPPQEEARAALMMPDDGAPSTGAGPTPVQNGGEQLTTGSTSAPATTGGSTGPVGPIGATTQTMPAKFSHQNDVLDRVPTMAWPLPLNKQQREQIYNAVMGDDSHPAVGAATLKPSDKLSFEQTRDLHPLPRAVAGMDGLHGLEYLKGENKVLLVRPPNAIVVDEVTL